MREQRIKFGQWMPDLPPHSNPGALEARNCIPEMNSYRSLRGLVAYSNALDDPALGAYWMQDNANTILNFAGDTGKLYELVGTTWTDRSKVGSPAYTADHWEFSKYGDRLIAVDVNDVPQYFDIGVSANFADLPGSPPQAARIAVVRDFVVLGDLDNQPNFIRWSGFNNSEEWSSLNAQSDSQELFGRGGRVQRIVPGQYGIIFQEHAIWRMTYVGPPIIFQLDEVERSKGTPAGDSVVWNGSDVYYLGHDGFYRFDGARSHPIGESRVNRWFYGTADPSSYSTIRAAIDRRNRLVIWAFKSSGSAAQNDSLLIYNFGADRWSYGKVDTQLLVELLSVGFTLDTLDAALPGGIDANSIPVDSPDYVGGNLSFQAFDSSNQGALFNGSVLTAELEAREISSPDGRRMFIHEVRPEVSAFGATIEVKMGERDQMQSGFPSYDVGVAIDDTGKANVRKNARYHRVRLCISDDDFEHAEGFVMRARKAGRR